MGSSYCPHDITQCALTNQSINLLIILRNVDQLDMLAGTICMLTVPWYIKRKTWKRQLVLLLPVTVVGGLCPSCRVQRTWIPEEDPGWWGDGISRSGESSHRCYRYIFTSSSLIFFSLRLSHNFNTLRLFVQNMMNLISFCVKFML